MLNILNTFPLISALFIVVLGGFVLIKSRRSRIGVLFTLFCAACTVWFFGTFMALSGYDQFFWDKFIYCGVIFIPITLYHFGVEFLDNRRPRDLFLVIGYIFAGVFLFLNLFTPWFTDGLWHYTWGSHLKAQFFHHVYLVYFFLYLGYLFLQFLWYYHRQKQFERHDVAIKKFVLLSIFLATFGWIGFLPAYGVDIYPFTYLSGLFFAATMGYAIMRYDFLGGRQPGYLLFIIFIDIIAFVQIFSVTEIADILAHVFLFIIVVVFGVILSRSIQQEMQQKEDLLKMRNDLERANVELKRLDMSKSEFISIASHQLRTPLTAIKGYISLILEGAYGQNAEKTQDALNKIFMANERLIQLVEDMLNLTRIESGRLEYRVEDNVCVEDIIHDLQESFAMRAQEKNLDFIVDLPDAPLPTITADKTKLREVISNIIDNAIKYTKEGFVRVIARRCGKMVCITVEDSGMGISEESLKTLFSKFSRGTDSTKAYTDGTGLGLYVGKNLIESQGGRIYAESEGTGKGSRFTIEMPLSLRK